MLPNSCRFDPYGLALAAMFGISLVGPAGARAAAGGGPVPEDAPGRPMYRTAVASEPVRAAGAIAVLLADEQRQITELCAQRVRATRPDEIAEFQRQIESIKRGTETRVAQVRLNEARRGGDAYLIQKLEQRLTVLSAPATAPAARKGGAQ